MAFILAGAGKLFVLILHESRRRLWMRIDVPPWVRPALGGLAMGAIACALPQVAGIGYGWLQEAILWTGHFALGWMSVALLTAIALAKMVATSCTISSGGSGGDFGPSLVIGGLLGAACGQAFHLLMPRVVMQPGAFALVGMATFYGGIAHVPLASLIMTCELTGSYDLLVPLMLCEGLAYALLRRTALYDKQVRSPLDSPAHAGELAVDVLAQLHVADVCDRRTAVEAVPMRLPLRKLLDQLAETRCAVFPVSDASGKIAGLVALATLRQLLSEELSGPQLLVGDATERLVSVTSDDPLSTALDRLLASGYPELPVIDPETPDRVIGLIGHSENVTAYTRELARRRAASE
jgi:CIC family chloride channel protein